MRKFLLLLVFAGIIAGTYLAFNPDRRAGLEVQVKDLVTGPTTRVYKWKDTQGQTQLTDTPPPDNIPFEVIEVPNKVNLVPAESLTGKKTE